MCSEPCYPCLLRPCPTPAAAGQTRGRLSLRRLPLVRLVWLPVAEVGAASCGPAQRKRNGRAGAVFCEILVRCADLARNARAVTRLVHGFILAKAGVIAKLNGLYGASAPHDDSREWRNWQTRWLQVPVLERAWGFKSPLAHANEMAPDLGFYLSGWGSFASEVLEKVLRAMCEWFRTATETVLSGSVR